MASDSNNSDGEENNEKIIPRNIEDEMKKSYIDYSMSVIVGRALPDVRDGLKPVHRRILYAMHEAGITASKPHKKSARIVGDVLGKYHPHGDAAVYDTMVRMAQDFSLRYPLIDGQGNFGSVDGDAAAAMRYTESRMAKIAEELLADIEKETVNFMPNYDASLNEPVVLPGKLPNLLINGSSGIAVGMATNIPPHNLSEIIDGIIKIIDEPEIAISELMEIIKGPDFPTAGIIQGTSGIMSYYATGRGRIRLRAKADTESEEGRIIVTELPYQVNKANLIENIAHLVKDKKIEGIRDLRDESDREGMRIVIELKRDAQEEVVLNQLFKHTMMQTTFGVIMLALVDNQPKIMGLIEIINHYLEHRKVVVRRRTEYELKKAEERAHILEGLIIALDNIEEVIKIIRSSKTVEIAKNELMINFELSEIQAKAILDVRLSKLTGLEIENVKKEYNELLELIKKLKEILASEEKILNIIKEELAEIKEKYCKKDARRTRIDEFSDDDDIDDEDLIPDEDVVVTTTNTGYIKRIPIDTYTIQKRGGKGLIGMKTKEEDFIVDLFIASTHDYILFFTNKGQVFWLKTYKIPASGRHAKGKAIINLIPRLEDDEKINATIPVKVFDDEHYLIFATKKGVVKKTALSQFRHPRINGIRAIKLDEGDEVIATLMSDGTREVIIATKNGQACRFREQDTRPIGRSTRGVRGIRLNKGDEVVGMAVVNESQNLLTITEKGYGKQSMVSAYRKTKRGGKGVKTIITNERNGGVISIIPSSDANDEFIIMSEQGMVIRIDASNIRVMGRNTMGVRIMRMNEGDKVVSVAKLD
ncbi:DNA gyrase subunit A [Candidatus Altiarchaeales archaeon WOR_SM1_SCG]|nr:DNA gyrase subunit A [Candidatus Altiarchaeales archaeon WOR_SM1_SCG]